MTADPLKGYREALAYAQAERPLQQLADQARAAADREAAALDDDTMAGVARALRIVPPMPGTTEAELLRAWAEAVLPRVVEAMRQVAVAMQPLAELVAQHQEAEQQRTRAAVPFWTEQPNRTRRRR